MKIWNDIICMQLELKINLVEQNLNYKIEYIKLILIKFNNWIKIQLKKNEMQIDETHIENLFMFKYMVLKCFFGKNTYIKERTFIHFYLRMC